jgi:hypothetical protein
MVRMYHGGSETPRDTALWFTSHKPKAENWGAGNNQVWYVDLPENYPLITKAAARDGVVRDHLLADIHDIVKANGGSPLTKRELARAVELWEKKGLDEAPEILERLALELTDDAIDSGATHGEEPVAIPGWDDAAHPGGAPGASRVVPPIPAAEGAAGGAARGVGGEGAGTQAAADEFGREFFQRRRTARDLIAEREAEGQLGLPGTERIGQGELARRKANEPPAC